MTTRFLPHLAWVLILSLLCGPFVPVDAQAPAAALDCAPALVVTNAFDGGPGSLRDQMAGLCPGGMITFDNSYTVTLNSHLVVDKNMTIDGAGHSITV